MNCDAAETLLAKAITREIGASERRVLDAHLLECEACRTDLELAEAGGRAVLPDEPFPVHLEGVGRTIARKPPVLVRVLRWGTAAAAALFVGLLLAEPPPSSDPEPEPAPVGKQPEPPRVLAFMKHGAVGRLVGRDTKGNEVGELALKSHTVSVEILDGIAKTTVEENFENLTPSRLEGTFFFPLPPNASITRLALEVNGKIEEGTVLEKNRAREVFESIVRRMKDPALLEWMPGGIFKCRVFPIEPWSTKRVIVGYTQALPSHDGKMTYVYPLVSEKTSAHPPGEVKIDVRAKFGGKLARISSPSHPVDIIRPDDRRASGSYRVAGKRPTKGFVLSLEAREPELRLIPHKVDGSDGYFALLLTPEIRTPRTPGKTVFVLDVSASVSLPELEVAKNLVLAMMDKAVPGDTFEIYAHHLFVDKSGEVSREGAEKFLDGLVPLGGSDVLRALLEAPEESRIVYIGEGTPTMGVRETARILDAVKGRSIRTIAVGSDANIPLLRKLGGHFQVSPSDDVNRRVGEIAETFGKPVLTDLAIDGGDALYDLAGLRSVYAGERLVVTGRHRGQAAKIVVKAPGYRRELDVTLPKKEEANNYVRRMWARMKVGELMALEGKEQEITALGVEHQIMTPYTSFLVLESEKMWKDHMLKRVVQKQDEVLAKAKPETPTFGDEIDRLLQEGVELYNQGRYDDATSKFEEAFQMKPNSDQVYGFIKKAGEDIVAGMMNSRERQMQDVGRRLFELAKPGPGLRDGKATVRKYLEDLKSDRDEVWRNAFWHLKNFGPTAAAEVENALGRAENDRDRARLRLLLSESESKVPEPTPVPDHSRVTEAEARTQAGVVEERIRLMRDLNQLQERHMEELAKLAKETGNQSKATLIIDLQRKLDFSNSQLVKLQADQEVFVRQLEIQLAQIQELTDRVEKSRHKLAVALNAKSLAVAELQYARQMAERLQQDVAELEGKHIELARNKKHLEAKINHLNQIGVKTEVRPRRRVGRVQTGVPILNDIPLKGFLFGGDDGGIYFPPAEGESAPPDIFSITTNVTIAGAPIADPLPVALNGRLRNQGVRPDVAPKKPLEAKVTATANEIGLVVISIGKDDGVLEGDEFTIYRGGDFVAKIVIDRADRKWSAGKTVLKKMEPRSTDDVSNHIFVSAPGARVFAAPLKPVEAAVGGAGSGSGAVRVTAGSDKGLRKDHLLLVTRDSEFVAILIVTKTSKDQAEAAVWRNLLIGRIRAGDQVRTIVDLDKTLSEISPRARLDLGSKLNLARIRSLMRAVK